MKAEFETVPFVNAESIGVTFREVHSGVCHTVSMERLGAWPNTLGEFIVTPRYTQMLRVAKGEVLDMIQTAKELEL